jgi:hypothetical protein
MSLYFIPTKRYVSDKTALQRGVIENPQNFRLPPNLQIYQRPNKRYKSGFESLITLDKREQTKFSKRGYALVYPQQKQVYIKSLDFIDTNEEDWYNAFFELPNDMAEEFNIREGVIEMAFMNGNRIINQQFLNIDTIDQTEHTWWQIKGFFMYNWSSTMKLGIYTGTGNDRQLKTEQTKQFIEQSTDFRITKYKNIQAYNRTQSYRDGDTHCILHPVQLYYEGLVADAVSPKTKDNRKSLLNKVIFFLKKYKTGIPDDKMEEVAKALEVCFIIQDITYNELKRYNAKAKGHRFTYVNSRINHCDIITIDMHSEPEAIEAEEAVALLEYYKTNNIHHTFTGTVSNPKTIRSPERWVRVGDDNSDTMHEFFKLFDKGMSIDTIKERSLTNFLLEACHLNINWNNKKAVGEPVMELDIVKAYTQFKHCPYYMGFPGIINNVRETTPDHDTKTYPGVYEINIDKLEALNAYEEISMKRNQKAYDLLKAYGFKSNNKYILTSAWIEQLKALKVKYTVLRGAWGKRFDFDFTPDMIDSKLYAVWTGLNMCKEDQHYYKTYATPEFAEIIQAQQPTSTMTYDQYTETLMIQKPKDVNKIMPHIAAFIISYTQLNVFQEAMKYDIADIYAHKLDSIVLTTTKVKPITNSAIWTVEQGDIKLSKYPVPHIINKSTNHYKFRETATVLGDQFISGAGGSGKTHTILSDIGFRKVLFASTAWKLITEKALEYKIKGSSINGLIGVGYDNKAIPTVKERFGSPGVVVVDELSMIDGNNIEKIKQLYPLSQIILMGDYEDGRYYQSSITMDGRTVYHPPTYKLITADYRSLDDETKVMKATVRTMMKDKSMKAITDYIKSVAPKISVDELKASYDLDYVLTGTHSRVQVFTDLLKDEKNHYLVMKHGFEDVGKRLASVPNTYLSGEILDKEIPGRTKMVHAFTVHSFQGSTIPINKKCFVDLSNLKAVEDIYTAISRVRTVKQLYIIN